MGCGGPASEHGTPDPQRAQKSWRTAWRALVRETGRQAGKRAAAEALRAGGRISAAKAAWKREAGVYASFRFHDLRHQSITELAEAGAPDSVIQAIAGHISKRMMDHYSHVRMAAKRDAVDALAGGLMQPVGGDSETASKPV